MNPADWNEFGSDVELPSEGYIIAYRERDGFASIEVANYFDHDDGYCSTQRYTYSHWLPFVPPITSK